MYKQILRLALPNIITNITVPLLGMVDLAIVGHIGDTRYIGAIAIATMIFSMIYWLFGFLRMASRHRRTEQTIWTNLPIYCFVRCR